MTKATTTDPNADFVSDVRRLIAERVESILADIGQDAADAELTSGKMIRTRFADRLVAGGGVSTARDDLVRLCAATEIVHTASLCHDDIIDEAPTRRGGEALWRLTGATGAILVGDRLFCTAMELVADTTGGRFVAEFIAKVGQIITAECEQELVLRGREADEQTCLRLARCKTGPLFAFPAWACGEDDERLASALAEAGYRIGTAYQLADDLFDVAGSEGQTGKTPGADAKRKKFTLPQVASGGAEAVRRLVVDLCESALEELADHADVRAAAERFITEDLQPALVRFDPALNSLLGYVS